MLKIKIRVICIYIEGKWIVMGLLEFEIYVFYVSGICIWIWCDYSI